MCRTALIASIISLLFSFESFADQINEGLDAFDAAQYETAYTLLSQSKKTDDPRLNYVLGVISMDGLGKRVNKQEARRFLQKAAAQGHLEATYRLGKLYSTGKLKAQAYVVAVKWFEKAVSKGHVASQYSLAKLYLEGKGVAKDPAMAHELMLQAANGGSIDAQLIMATNTAQLEQKIAWFSKAANQGDYRAQKSLGDLYAANTTLSDYESNALHWYQLAAANGSDGATLALGKLYETGSKAIQSDDKALKWYRQAMELDLSIAAFHVESLTQKKCEKTAETTVLSQFVFCASRAQIQQVMIDNGGEIDYLASTLDEDIFTQVHAFNSNTQLSVLYQSGVVQKLDFSFPKQTHSDEFLRLAKLLASDYGEAKTMSRENRELRAITWLMQDEVEISLFKDDVADTIVLRFSKN
jgi:TPR repeat protein